MSMHVPRQLWLHCTWPNCQFRYSDGSSYNKHKIRKHAWEAGPRKERDPSTYYRKNQRTRHADREESVDSEVYDLPQESPLWSSTRHSSPGSDVSDTSYHFNVPSTSYTSSSSLFNPPVNTRGNYFSTALTPNDAGNFVYPLQTTLGYTTDPYYSAPWNAAPTAGWAPNGTYSYTAPSTSISPFGNYPLPGLVDYSSRATPADQMMASALSSGAPFYDNANVDTTELDFSEPTIAEILAELAEIEEHLRS
ncbi:hypothetical protein EIP86_004952 [Pleurotus ostreatoroseus]|nr:hypothetical protein EIP86_004952 [Pleurotus ostreatoroseus]